MYGALSNKDSRRFMIYTTSVNKTNLGKFLLNRKTNLINWKKIKVIKLTAILAKLFMLDNVKEILG